MKQRKVTTLRRVTMADVHGQRPVPSRPDWGEDGHERIATLTGEKLRDVTTDRLRFSVVALHVAAE